MNFLSTTRRQGQAHKHNAHVHQHQPGCHSLHYLLLIVNVIIKKLFYRNDDQILVGVNEVDDKDEEYHHMNMERIRK